MSLTYKKLHSNKDKKLKKRCRNRDNNITTTTTTTMVTNANNNNNNNRTLVAYPSGGGGGGHKSTLYNNVMVNTNGSNGNGNGNGNGGYSGSSGGGSNGSGGGSGGGSGSSQGGSYLYKKRIKKATKNKHPSKNYHQHLKRHTNNKCYKVGSVIGVGTFGEVRECIDIIKNRHYAVKIVDVNRWCDDLKHRIDNEIKLLRLMDHRHIISLIRVHQDVPFSGKYCLDCGCTNFHKKSFPRARYEQYLTIPKSPSHRHMKKMKTSKNISGGGDISSSSFSSSSSEDWSDSSELNMEEYVLHSSGNTPTNIDHHNSNNKVGIGINTINTNSSSHFKNETNMTTSTTATTTVATTAHNSSNLHGLSGTCQHNISSRMETSMNSGDRYGNVMSMNGTQRYEDESNHDKSSGVKNTGNSSMSSMHEEVCKFCAPHAESQHTMEETRHVTLIVQELAIGGEMFSMIKCGGAFDEDVCRYYFRQLIFGVQYLHDHGIIHRDLKLENLVFSANFDLKIVDFGLATTVDEADRRGRFHSGIGSLPYTSPEVKYQKELYGDRGYKGQPADIWSTGVILYVMLVGKRPFKRPVQKTHGDILGCPHFCRIVQGIYPAVISVDAQDLLSRIFMVDPDDRCTIEDIISHPWFNGTVPNTEDLYAYMIDRSQRVWKEDGIPHMIPILQEMHHKAVQEDLELSIQENVPSNENVEEEVEMAQSSPSPTPPPNPMPQLSSLNIPLPEKRLNTNLGTNSSTVVSSSGSSSSSSSFVASSPNDSKTTKGTTTPPRIRSINEESSTKVQTPPTVTTITVTPADKNSRNDYGSHEDSNESEGELTMPRPVNMTPEARAVAEVAERAYQWERQQALERKRRRRGLVKDKSPTAELGTNTSSVQPKHKSTNTYIADNVQGHQKNIEVKNIKANLHQNDHSQEHKSSNEPNIATIEETTVTPAPCESNEGQTSSNEEPPSQPLCGDFNEYMMSSATSQRAQFLFTKNYENSNSNTFVLDALGKQTTSNETIKNTTQSESNQQLQEQKQGN